MAANGMVASAYPLASVAGLNVLRDGGNAFDAAVAVGSTLSVVEPHMSGVGGVGVALAYVAGEGRVRALNFSGRAPMAAHPSIYTEESKETGALAPLVPGNVAGWLALHGQYGTLEPERLFEPAIDYAENGFPISALTCFVIEESAPRLSQFPTSVRALLGLEGRAPEPGALLKMPELAESLRVIAAGGREAFYQGELAGRIVEGVRSAGGVFAGEDLASYEVEWQDPISVNYRGYEILTTPPNSFGFQILQTMRLMGSFSDDEVGYHEPDTVHLLAEALKLCVTDRAKYGGDHEYSAVPVSELLSEDYAAAQRERIDRATAAVLSGQRYRSASPAGAARPGGPGEFGLGETTHFVVADRDGNVVSVTQTLGAFFGSALAVGDTGIFLNNGCIWFDTDPESPTVVGPGRRVGFVLAPTHTLRDGRFYLSLGTTGGYGILQTTVQMLMNLLDFGMDVQQAIESARFICSEGLTLTVEEGYPPQIRRALSRRGHRIALIDGYPMGLGAAHGIRVDSEHGVFHGGADPRRDGIALGW